MVEICPVVLFTDGPCVPFRGTATPGRARFNVFLSRGKPVTEPRLFYLPNSAVGSTFAGTAHHLKSTICKTKTPNPWRKIPRRPLSARVGLRSRVFFVSEAGRAAGSNPPIANSCRICTCSIVILKPSSESTLPQKRVWPLLLDRPVSP
jgi:hypothetical protein